jgi:hypothetical protein
LPVQTEPRSDPSGQTARPRVLGVLLISAADLPKMDVLGTCDGFCVVDLGGRQQATKPVKNCYNPEWGCEFLFHIPCAPAAGALTVQVWDWKRVGKDRLVGTHEVPAAKVAAMCSRPVGWKQEETVPLIRKGKAVTGYSKKLTTLRLRFCLLEGPSVGTPLPMDGASKVTS